MSLMMSASGFPCVEGPVHFWEEERKQAESDRRITGFLSCCLLESSSDRQAVPSSALLITFLTSAQLAAAAPVFVQFEEASSHDPPAV